MKLQTAATSGPMGVPIMGAGIVQTLPQDTGEWLAFLSTATGAPTQGLAAPQEDLLDRISFQNDRASINERLEDVVKPALDELLAAARRLFESALGEVATSCEYDAASRECFILAKITIHPTSTAEETYAKYQELMAAVASARSKAGNLNLDVDILID